MVTYKFDTQVFVDTEATEGTAETITAADYVQVFEDNSLTLTPFHVARPLARPSFTMVPDYFPSTGVTSSDNVVVAAELTMTVELSAKVGGPQTAVPAYDPLLVACGFARIDTVEGQTITSSGAISGGPYFHREQVTGTGGPLRTVGTVFTGDTTMFFTGAEISGGGGTATGTVSGATCALNVTPYPIGIAYHPETAVGVGDGSSCTIQVTANGRTFTLKGCRGNVVFNFTAMERITMTFTMQGILHNIAATTKINAISYGHLIPPAFVNVGFRLREATGSTNYTTPMFSTMSIDFGNQIVTRTNANSLNGWKSAQITGREPTLSFNPDSVDGGATSATVFDFFEKWAEGTPCRMHLEVGKVGAGSIVTAPQGFIFKAPFMVFDGVVQGERDNYSVFDCTAKLSGGFVGDSIVHTGNGDVQQYDDIGADNELVLIMTGAG